jgi:hypothetical protein
MITFDQMIPILVDIFEAQRAVLPAIGRIIVNRDLNGRVRLIVSATITGSARSSVTALAEEIYQKLQPHAYPPEQGVLFETDLAAATANVPTFPLPELPDVLLVDRLASDSDWACIVPESTGVPRVVFYSIKGGVGRSTALAATAWALAQAGQRVLVLDLDLESPGLSSALLPEDRRPAFGIADWLVEDLLDQGGDLLEDLFASSSLSHDGEIFVVPAHGREPGEYIAKLGRVWMPKVDGSGNHEPWVQRLSRLIDQLENRLQPDVILIDSRAGIDEVAASCIAGLGAALVLLFAIDGDQTWSGYRVLFEHWHRAGKVSEIRNRLQLVGAMIPDDASRQDYFERLREASADLFAENLYDEIPPGEPEADYFNFDEGDISAPHYPWAVRWQRGFAALRSLHARLETIDADEVAAVFGPLIGELENALDLNGTDA